MSQRRAVIHNRRFYWKGEDGRLSPIRVTDRLLAQLRQPHLQTKQPVANTSARKAPPTPRAPGTGLTLPAANKDIGDQTLDELARAYGWSSSYLFANALREHRLVIYERACSNGFKRRSANLLATPKLGDHA